jgi:hypothetical protein
MVGASYFEHDTAADTKYD